MKTKQKIGLILLLSAAIVAITGWYLHRYSLPVLQPVGTIGLKERQLIIFCSAISVTIVVPVFGMLGMFAWKYRETAPKKAKYQPELDGNRLAETVWWLVPAILLAVISVVNWRSTYALDPFKPLKSTKSTLHIQVVALDWKWLFIYPDQHAASVGQAAIPVNTPVDFEITSDAVMTSFWAPSLGGQMYAMPGMSTHLNLDATKLGDNRGVAANISGQGFAGMTFNVKAVSDQGFQQWTQAVRRSPNQLTAAAYSSLARPSNYTTPVYYKSVDSNLYDTIVMNYMMPMGQNKNTTGATQ